MLLKKPRRGWWVAPGGKVEPKETVLEAVCREYEEETGLILRDPLLCGVFTMCLVERGELEKEWMMFTFRAEEFHGELLSHSPEGELSWHPLDQVGSLPTSEMDRKIFTYLLEGRNLSIGRLEYSREEELLSHHLH
ncbi:putative Nudix hydrolase YvcI [Kroppenstedtia guangzhouensis]|uniref:Nudix hydrolase YvcI n=1 Tax=Kroppenstedtia guangzhouensis TaxID=1274356 RepID=A0ABQ1GK95_9BACL|nr:putative Nudix hydrolase YvcI [Kroppenstedtia guangzhouensis]